MPRVPAIALATVLLAGCGGSGGGTASTATTAPAASTLTRAKTGRPGDLTALQRRSATRACAPIRSLPAAQNGLDSRAAVALAATLEQPALATGAQLDRIAHARTKTNDALAALASAYRQLASAYNALATVSPGNDKLTGALLQRAVAAAQIVALEARALRLTACVPRAG